MDVTELANAERALKFWEVARNVFAGMVALGVVGEFVQDYKSSAAQKVVDEYRNEQIAKLNADAAGSRERAALLEQRLEDERKKREPRSLTEEQKTILATLRGRFKLAVVHEDDNESNLFAQSLTAPFIPETPGVGGVPYIEIRHSEMFGRQGGLTLYVPGVPYADGTSLHNDVVSRTFERAGLTIGYTDAPLVLSENNPQVASLPSDCYILFVGAKPLY